MKTITSPVVLPILESYIFNNNTSVRIKTYAVGNLKLIDDDLVAGLLKNLSVSKDESLREAAKGTITFRKEYFEKQKP